MSKQSSFYQSPNPTAQVYNSRLKKSVNMFVLQMHHCSLGSQYHFDGLAPWESIAWSTKLCFSETVKYMPIDGMDQRPESTLYSVGIHGRSSLLTSYGQVFSRNSQGLWFSPPLGQDLLPGNYKSLSCVLFLYKLCND